MSDAVVRWRQIRHHWEIYLFVVPTLLTIALFIYYPAFSGIYHSFFMWNGSDIAEPVGFANYSDLFRSSDFWRSFENAFLFGLWNVVKMLPPLFVAVAIHRCTSTRMQMFYRSMFVIPMVIPPLVIALIWRSFFFEATSGYLNRAIAMVGARPLLDALAPLVGWGNTFAAAGSPAWLGDPRLIKTAIVVWGFPWVGSLGVLTHLAKLQSIPKDIYEAAEMDGVNWWSKFTRIELPLITGSIYIMLVFTIIDTIKDAGMVLALAGFEGGPGGAADVPALFMLRRAFIYQQMGYACAVGIVLMFIVMGLQKTAALVMDWSSLSRGTQIAARAVGLSAGAALIASGRFIAPAIVMILVALPRAALWAWWDRWRPRRATVTPARPSPGDTRLRPPVRRAARTGPGPATRALRALGAAVPRGCKHLYIWGVLLFALLPLYLMLIVSLKTNKQFYAIPAAPTVPLHFENWRTAWEMISPTLANSMLLSLGSTGLMLFMALLAAYFFARLRVPMAGVFWNAILVLMMLPMIANLVPLFRLLLDLNLLNTLTALILVGAAQGQIFAIFMLRSFVADIPKDLYEAAEIDGASHWRQLWCVVLPLCGPILGTVGVMQFMHAWNEFVLPLIVMRDHTRLPVMVQLMRMSGEYIKLWGPLMAGYAMAALPIIALFIASMRLFIRGMTEGAVKG